MKHPLDGARAKVHRAGEHLNELDAEIQRFIERHPYRFLFERDPNTGDLVCRLRAVSTEEAPPLRWGVLVGDIAHNLRSALDHIACQLAALQRASCEKTQFPLANSPSDFADQTRRRLGGVSTRHRAMIRRIQPYNGRKSGTLLAVLRDMSNADKHRVLTGVIFAMTPSPPRFDPPGAVVQMSVRYPERVRMKDGAEYFRLTRLEVRPNAKVGVYVDPSFNVVFGEPDEYEVSARSLRELRDYVRTLVWRFGREL